MPDTHTPLLPVSLDDVRAAAEVISGQVERTPLRKSRTLSEITGAEVWVKFENLQFTASFKERGALNKLSKLTDAEKQAGVIAMSAGNHAQGVAYHAQRLGIPATIVMPKGTPFNKVKHTRAHGARVLLEGESLQEAAEHAERLRNEHGFTFIHPYDDADIIAGQGTIALEMLEDAPTLDTLVVPVGGGGLCGGMAVAAKALKPSIRIVAAEAALYPALHSERLGREARVGGATIAEGIAVKSVGRRNWEILRHLCDDVLLADEEHLERAITLFVEVEKTIAEGAGAAGLAVMLAHPAAFAGRKVGLVLCGGNIDTRLLASVLTRALVRERRLTSIRVVSEDRPGTLSNVSRIIGDAGANIMEVAHNRIALDVPAKGAEFDILIETRDAQHTQEVIDALNAAGYPLRNLNKI